MVTRHESLKSDHALLLNALHEMSISPAYALRREVLEKAEQLIFDMEMKLKQTRCAPHSARQAASRKLPDVLLPVAQMVGADWNILDATGARVIIAGSLEGDKWETNPALAAALVEMINRAAPAVQAEQAKDAGENFRPRELVTLNGLQIKGLLDAVNDGTSPDPETEITLIEHDSPFKSSDGDDMPAGTYFYWTEYPEEGIVLLSDSIDAAIQSGSKP